MLLQFYQFFYKKLRLSNPWNYKVPLLISIPYFLVYNGNIPHNTFFYAILSAYTTTVGFLGIAYLNNDLSDRGNDKLAQKSNALFNKSSSQIILLYFIFTILALAPWWFLPFDSISGLLIILELTLFCLYSFKPFRLKERTYWGLIADSLYAHVIPATLASWTFYLIINKDYPQYFWFLLTLVLWQFISGLRNILSHQIKDLKNDEQSNTRTWVLELGKEKAQFILQRIFIPLEFISFAAYLMVLNQVNPFIIVITILYWLYSYRQYRKLHLIPEETPSKHLTNLFLDNYYTQWFPLVILVSIIFIQTEVRLVLLMHLIFFVGPIKNRVIGGIHYVRNKFLKSRLVSWCFSFKSYFTGLFLHLGILILYSSLFCLFYFILEKYIAHPTDFLFYQKILSRLLVAFILIHLGSFFIFRNRESMQELKSFFLEKSTAKNLAVFRIIAFYFILRSFSNEIFISFEKWSHLPESAKVGLPFIGWLIDMIPINPEIYSNLSQIGYVLAICGFVGFQTKWTLKLYIPIALYLWGVPCFFGKLNHHHIMVWVPMILAFSPCSDAYSIDALINRLRKKQNNKEKKSSHYGLTFKFIWISLAGIYCLSGFHKLWDTGLYWALSDNLSNQIQLEWIENYNQVSSFRIDQYPLLLKISGLLVILFEITYPLFLLRPATRFMNFAGSWMLHLTAGYFLNIDFSYLRKMHFSLIDWEKWFNKLKKLLGFKFEVKESHEPSEKAFNNKALLYFGGSLVSANILFGILGISTWPISAYPAYAGIIPNEVQFIKMTARDCDGHLINVKKIGKKANFRWENIRPFEERIAQDINELDAEELSLKLKAYWDLWRTKVPELEIVSEVKMELITRPLKPEENQVILDNQYLGTVNLKDKCPSK